MYIEELFPGVNLEDENIEFKGIIEEGEYSKSKKERKEFGWLKELVAFANTSGGSIYVGVNNKTHTIMSLDHNTFDSISLMVQRLVKEHIEPMLDYKIEKKIVPDTSPIRYILIINVNPSKYLPVTLHFNGTGSIFCRHFGQCSLATSEEIRAMVLNNSNVSYDCLSSNLKFYKKDFSLLYELYKSRNDGKELNEKILISIGFMSIDGVLNKGALLFKDNYHLDNTLVRCTQFLGSNKGDNIFYANQDFQENLLLEYIHIKEFILNRVANGFIKNGDTRKPLISYPERALEEGLINALAHRNYFIIGSQIEINLYNDRLEIISPGSLISKNWLKHEKSLSSIPPLRRNPLICNVFSLLKLMEMKGSGFDKIEQEYLGYGENYRPYVDSDNSVFSLTLPNLSHYGGLVMSQDNPNVHIIDDAVNAKELKILSYCYNQARSASQIADFLNIKPSTYFRKNLLLKLVEKGYLIQQIDKSPTLYRSNLNKVLSD